MRVLLAVAASVLWSTTALAVIPVPTHDSDSGPGSPQAPAMAPCTDDVYCGTLVNYPGNGGFCFIADGEYNPSSNKVGWITFDGFLLITDGFCVQENLIPCAGPNFDNTVPRGFAWDKDAASGKFWVGSWFVSPSSPGLLHMDAVGGEIGYYTYPDPANPGVSVQPAGLAMDYATGHLWGQLRNNPAGTVTRFVLWDTNVPDGTAPVLLGGPWPVPYQGGPAAAGASGLEYYQPDCSLIAMRQDTENLGLGKIYKFQDVGIAAPTLLGFCDLNNIPCTGAGQSNNKPWGIAVSEDPAYPPGYILYSDLNVDTGCASPLCPADLHIAALPDFLGQCGVTAVEPTTWGKIKDSYK